MTARLLEPGAGAVTEWLPDDALVSPASLAALDAGIAAWSARWFIRPLGRQEGGPPASARASISIRPAARHGWRRFGPGIWLDWGEQAAQALALHALGRAGLRLKLTADDEQLLASLGERLARDLVTSLGTKRGMPPAPAFFDHEAGPGKALTFRLGSATPVLAIAVDATILVGLRKQQCAAWRPRDVQPRPLSAAVGSVPVDFAVALGGVRIGLLEFEAIEPGDTILLDQPVAAPIAVRAAASGAAIRHAKLVREDGQLMLTAS